MSDLTRLLHTWKLQNILPHLIDEEIDIDTLRIMKIPHIKALLRNFPLGIQIRFEHQLEQWRCQIGKPLKCTANYLRNGSVLNEPLDEDLLVDGTKINSIKETARDLSCPKNLKQILLKNNPEGAILLDIYDKNQCFSNPERSHLIDLIANYCVRHDLPFDLYDSYDFENAILALFPNEKLDFYRNAKEGKIYKKYLSAKAVYYNNEAGETSNNFTSKEDLLISKGFKDKIQAVEVSNLGHEHSQNLLTVSDHCLEEMNFSVMSAAQKPTEILLQTIYNGCKKFVKIGEPFLLKNFFSSACSIFDIHNKGNIFVVVNDCEIAAEDFKNIILQYYKLPTFSIELKEKAVETKIEPIESSSSQTDYDTLKKSFTPPKDFNLNRHHNTTAQTAANNLPNADDIRNIPSLLPIVKMSDDGRPLENKHRTTIAKAVIDECLNYQPERVLKRQDFLALTNNLMQAFPNEVASAYFIPSQRNQAARGKLWNVYNNKRSFFGSSGIVQRRQHYSAKRKLHSDDEEDSEKTNDKIYITENFLESEEFSINSSLDWDILQQKWSNCHHERRNELLKDKISPQRYMQKYSILKSNRGIDLMEIDVNILHPTVVNVNNWLSLYKKVIEMGRKLQKLDHILKVLENIDSSKDEKYRASLALLIIPYIFPYNGRRNEFNEKASKYEIQKRFIKEYTSLDELKSDIECADLQIRFFHECHQINYAEFKIGGHTFKSVDLLEALSSIFHYSIAMNVEYPKMCLHIWQFIQLAIFQIEIQGCQQPNVESTINDLYML